MGYTLNPFTGNFDATGSGGGGGGSVNSVSASAPLNSTGGANPNISLSGIVNTLHGGTGLSAAGTLGNVLTSDGTNWVSSAPASGGANTSLSNLITTSINQDLIPNTSGFYNLGDGGTGTAWQGLYVNAIYDNAAIEAIDIAGRFLVDNTSSPVATWSGLGLDLNSKLISNLADPVSAQDAATKAYVDSAGSSPGGSDTQIQFNDSGSFGADSTFTFDKATKILTASQISIDPAYVSSYWGGPNPTILGDSPSIPSGNALILATSDLNSGPDSTTADISIQTGDNNLVGSSSSNTGYFYFTTGSHYDATSTGVTGDAYFTTGSNAGSGNSGVISISTGFVQGSTSGTVTINSGNANTGSSGQVNLNSGGSTSGNSGHTVITTGNAPSGNSGAIQLITGGASGTRGKIVMQTGSEGTTGHVWTSTDNFGSGAWAAPSGGANTALSNLITTSINQDLLPSANNTRSLGSSSLKWANLNTVGITLSGSIIPDIPSNRNVGLPSNRLNGVFALTIAGDSFVVPSDASKAQGLYNNKVNADGVTYSLGLVTGVNERTALGISTGNDATVDAVATGNIFIGTGNKTTSTGNSGNIIARVGTSAGGTRGKIQFVNGTEGTSGHVWTSTDTSGSGSWSAISAANTALSNLASTAVNVSILPGTDAAINLGSSAKRWASLSLSSEAAIYSNGAVGFSIYDTAVNKAFGLNASYTGGITLPSGTSVKAGIRAGYFTGTDQYDTGLWSDSNGVSNANPTGSYRIETGNKSAGTGNSGSITFQTGTSAGGTRGDVVLNSRLVTSTGPIVLPNYVVSALPSAATSGSGATAFVTDATAPSFGVAVTGGGAVKVPVYSDGSSWIVG